MTFDTATLRRDLAGSGFAYLEPSAPVDFESELETLGPLLPQYNGMTVRDIKPDPSVSDDHYSPVNSAALTPHTEWYEFPGLPPRYVALWCVHQAAGAGGETTLADGHDMIARFPATEREQLYRRRYEWRSHDTLSREDEHTATTTHPLVEDHPGGPIVRFSTEDLQTTDELSETYIGAGLEYFKRHHTAVAIAPGAVLVWDNWRMLHARNAFTDPHRHLRRALIGTLPTP